MNATEGQKIAAMQRTFPGAVKFHNPNEGRWIRPPHLAGESGEGHDGGAFYYENAEMPADRFYFETADAAWLDLWDEIGEEKDLNMSQHKTKEYWEGVNAGEKSPNPEPSGNPYDIQTPQYHDWNWGYMQGNQGLYDNNGYEPLTDTEQPA